MNKITEDVHVCGFFGWGACRNFTVKGNTATLLESECQSDYYMLGHHRYQPLSRTDFPV